MPVESELNCGQPERLRIENSGRIQFDRHRNRRWRGQQTVMAQTGIGLSTRCRNWSMLEVSQETDRRLSRLRWEFHRLVACHQKRTGCR